MQPNSLQLQTHATAAVQTLCKCQSGLFVQLLTWCGLSAPQHMDHAVKLQDADGQPLAVCQPSTGC